VELSASKLCVHTDCNQVFLHLFTHSAVFNWATELWQ